MKHFKTILITASASILLCGCSSPKVAQQRGWVGGSYIAVREKTIFPPDAGKVLAGLPEELKGKYRGGILISDLSAGTPLARAGLTEGDLILSINGSQTDQIKSFRRIIDASPPGQETKFTIYRANQILNPIVLIGREQFKTENFVTIGVGLSSHLHFDLLPDPDFSLAVLGLEQNDNRLQLSSVAQGYLKSLKPEASEKNGILSEEGWKTWLGIFSVGGRKRILTQQVLEKPNA
jgi:hypothetical protein